CANLVSRFRRLSINQNISIFYEPLQARTTPTFDSGRQKRVQPLADRFGCNRKCEVRIVIDFRVQAPACMFWSSAFRRRNRWILPPEGETPSLLLTRSDHGVRRQPIVDELVYIS